MLSLFIAEHCSINTCDHWKVIVKNCLIANKTTTIIENIVLFNVSVYASHPAETSNKTMFSIIVAVLFAVRRYSNSVHCLPKKMCVTQKKRYKMQLRCSKFRLKENCGPTSVVVKAHIFYPCPLIVSARPKTDL